MSVIRIALWAEALVGAHTGTKTFLINVCRHWIIDHGNRVQLTFVVRSAAEAEKLDQMFPEGNWHTTIYEGGKWPLRLAWLVGKRSLTRKIGEHDIYLSGWHWPLGRMDVPFVAVLHDLRSLDPIWRDVSRSKVRSALWQVTYRYAARACFQRAAAIVAPSQFTFAHAAELGLRANQPSRVIYHGIDRETWGAPVPAQDCAELRRRYDLPDDARYVITIGQHVPHKNAMNLVRAFAQGPAAQDPKALLLLAGGRNTESAAIEQLAVDLEVVDRVRLLGSLPFADLHQLVAGAHVFAFVSLFEGFGIPVIEGFAASVPVLTSSTTSLGEVAGEAALTVNPADVTAIADGLSQLWRDPDLRQSLIAKGRMRLGMFDWSQAAQDYIHLFDDVLEKAQ